MAGAPVSGARGEASGVVGAGGADASSGDAGPLDRTLDRRAFMARMGVLGAWAAAGCSATGPGALPGVGGAGWDPPAHGGTGLPARLLDPGHPFWVEARREVEARGRGAVPLHHLAAWEARVLMDDGRLEARALLEACLERIRSLDPHLLAFNTVSEAEARIRLSAAGRTGLLAGIPVAIKDNVHTAGVRTTANAHMFADFFPTRDATLVKRLVEAGALPVGKTQMGPLATTRALTPDGEVTTLNAWAPDDPRVSPGGSSSGSATAVAARMVTTSMGTQTGGSITVPASSQGLTGLKPTMGRVSLDGVIPLTYTRDHPGPLARDARDAALFMQAVAGPDPRDPRTLGLPPVPDYLLAATPHREGGEPRIRWATRLGVPLGWARGEGAQGDRRRAFVEAMEEGGVQVVEVPFPPGWEALTSGAMNAGRLPERSEPFLPWLREDVRLFGVTLSSWIQGLLLPSEAYLTAQRGRTALLRMVLEQLFDGCDALVMTSHLAFDMVGLPLVTFPLGFRDAAEGGGPAGRVLPEGVLVGGLPFGEERLLALAALWQAASDHHQRVPADPPVEAGVRGVGDRGRLDVETVADLSE